MTGQVKEDVLSRFGELGVFVEDGKLLFNPSLLRKDEFLSDSKVFKYTTVNKENKELVLESGSLCFTYCQIPIIYKLGGENTLQIIYNDGNMLNIGGLIVDSTNSHQIFSRSGEIDRMIVSLK